MDAEGNRMSSTRDMEPDRLASVKLSYVTGFGDLRVTGLVSEAGADEILGCLEAAAGGREPLGPFAIGHDSPTSTPAGCSSRQRAAGLQAASEAEVIRAWIVEAAGNFRLAPSSLGSRQSPSSASLCRSSYCAQGSFLARATRPAK